MEEFLKIVWETQEACGAVGNETGFFEPLENRLKELLSPKLYEEICDILASCQCNAQTYYATEGMKLAMGIMDKTYTIII